MILRILAALPLLLALPALLLSEEPHPAPLPLGAVDGAGVNIHFTNPRSGEMKMLAEGGFRWVRIDFAWGPTERERGRYDFAAGAGYGSRWTIRGPVIGAAPTTVRCIFRCTSTRCC